MATDALDASGVRYADISQFHHLDPATGQPFMMSTCYIIQSDATASRTCIGDPELPEPTPDEFFHTLQSAQDLHPTWIHFEGRTRGFLLPIFERIRECDSRGEKWWCGKECDTERPVVSLDVERPDHPWLWECVPQADVVFFAEVFAKSRVPSGDIEEFLQLASKQAKRGYVQPPLALHGLADDMGSLWVWWAAH
jgi:hypothetical protein